MKGEPGICARCDREVRLRATGPEGRICSACYARSTKAECSRCGDVLVPHSRDPEGRPVCKKCVLRPLVAAEVAATQVRISAVVRRAEPELEAAAINDAVAAVAHNIRYAGRLEDALADGHEVLLGGSVAPPVVDRLVLALQAAGATRVALPTCLGCGTTRWLTQRVDGLRACNWCAIKARVELCGGCGKDAPVSTRDADGLAVCYRCRFTDPETFEVCVRCHRLRHVTYRRPEGPLCGGCGRLHPVVACSVCGEVRPAASGSTRGAPKCSSCVRRRATCSACGKADRMVTMMFATGPVCSNCHKKAQAATGVCGVCGQRRRIDPRDPQQRGLCSDCAGLEPWSVCSVCRREDRIYEAGRCIACTLELRLMELLGSSTIRDPLLDSLVGSDQPRAALRWLAKPEPQAILGAMARGEMASTHEALDERPSTASREHLRQVLVVAGVLPDRNEQLVRLEAWVTEQLGAVESSDDRKVLDAFARWWVMQRYRRRIERVGRASPSHARSKMRAAIAFMGWLRAHGISLGDCTQAHIELWLAGPPGRASARDFLRWACQRRLAHDIDIIRRPATTPGRSEDADQLLVTARRFAVDDSLPLVDRVAGLLLLCYGQQLARVARLKRDDIVIGAAGTSIRFGPIETVLADPVDRLLGELLARPQGKATTGAPDRSQWLFPGALPGRPITPDALGLRLGSYGIDARTARNTVLLDLAAELAPAFLADLLGMQTTTAVRWVRRAGGDWAAYAAARSRH
ncbi:MAG: hypothetical protein QOI20_1148 [Acidimicrobiaceae bacterium]|nr:hypothetical protein [Acidimicrobiaceae bacterium]